VIPERVYQRVIRKADWIDGCLVSRYSAASHGYAQVGWHEDGVRYVTLCHLVVWRYVRGDIPDGMTVDHQTCHNRKCVNIAHLRLLSNFENGRRTHGRDWPLGQCINGHSNDLLVTESDGRRRCPVCKTESQRRYRERKRSLSDPCYSE
jgi:hypothetical protein